MKQLALALLLAAATLAFAVHGASAQTDHPFRPGHPTGNNLKADLKTFDFSRLFTVTDNSAVYGFIGNNYQRLRIKFISVKKDPSNPGTYLVYGKSKVKDNICTFNGTITISAIKKYSQTSYGTDNAYKNKGLKGEFGLTGSYEIKENMAQLHAGVFKGTFSTSFYLDKYNKVHYDDIDLSADGFTNNEFTGEWIDNKTGRHKKCNWGDYRIPGDGDLDIGAGEFSPADKYLKFGWQSVRDEAIASGKTAAASNAEKAKWWQ